MRYTHNIYIYIYIYIPYSLIFPPDLSEKPELVPTPRFGSPTDNRVRAAVTNEIGTPDPN